MILLRFWFCVFGSGADLPSWVELGFHVLETLKVIGGSFEDGFFTSYDHNLVRVHFYLFGSLLGFLG